MYVLAARTVYTADFGREEAMGLEAGELLELDAAEEQPRDLRWVLRVSLPFLLFGVLAASPFYFVWSRWSDSRDYYTHGPLIPFVSAYLVLRMRKKLTGENPPETGPLYAAAVGAGVLYWLFGDLGIGKRWLFAILVVAAAAYLIYHLRNLKPEPWKPGLFVLLPALFFCVVAGVHQIVSVGWFFVVIVLIGMVLYYLGKRAALIMAFPLLFLFSSVPLPEYKVQEITMPMKKFVTRRTAWIISSLPMGIYCESNGAIIEFSGEIDELGDDIKQVTVGDVCSGLRSLIALISFGLLFAYITPVSRTKKTILFLAAIPASFIANITRVMALALVTYQWDAKTATKDTLWTAMESTGFESIVSSLRSITNEPVHDFTGVMIFVVAFIALFGVERLLTYLEAKLGRSRSDFWCTAVSSAIVWHVTGIWLLLFKYRTTMSWPQLVSHTFIPYLVLFVARNQIVRLYNWTKERDGIGPLLTVPEIATEGADA
jgi:exosortase